jgi:hypothetical protein
VTGGALAEVNPHDFNIGSVQPTEQDLAPLGRPDDSNQPSAIETEPSQPQNQSEQSARPQRDRRRPAHLKDYVCHAIRHTTPSSPPEHTTSSGTPYSITHHIDYSRFSNKHRAFLAAILRNRFSQDVIRS